MQFAKSQTTNSHNFKSNKLANHQIYTFGLHRVADPQIPKSKFTNLNIQTTIKHFKQANLTKQTIRCAPLAMHATMHACAFCRFETAASRSFKQTLPPVCRKRRFEEQHLDKTESKAIEQQIIRLNKWVRRSINQAIYQSINHRACSQSIKHQVKIKIRISEKRASKSQ